MSVTINIIEEPSQNPESIKWFELNGLDMGTQSLFNNDTFGLTHDDRILDCDGCPMTEGDYQTIGVRNSL